jgi:hypothetical protein
VEIRSVNSRFLTLRFAFPDELRQAESSPGAEILTRKLKRGSIEVWVCLKAAPLPQPANTPQPLFHLPACCAVQSGKLPQVAALSVADQTEPTTKNHRSYQPETQLFR